MIRTAILAICLSLLVGAARAESVPEFSLGYANEHANTIVVVDEAGVVMESWRGTLMVGDKLPYKGNLKPISVIAIPVLGLPKSRESKIGSVTGKRRVLFL